MQKTLLILIGTILLIAGGILHFRNQIGDIRPAILPGTGPVPTETITASPRPSGKGIISEKVTGNFNLDSKYELGLFAKNLGRARNLELTPGGEVAVSNFENIIILPDKNRDGIADQQKIVLSGLDRTHGFVFHNNFLYVTEETKVTRYLWDEDKMTASQYKKLFDLPRGGNHFTRSIVFDRENKMYISLGSTCNVCHEEDPFLAAVIISEAEGTPPRLYSGGLRNSVALAVHPDTGRVWSAENGRDRIGDDIPPEEINILQDGGDYGWPNCYGNRVHDRDFENTSESVQRCENSIPAIWGMQAHTAPLGMSFIPAAFNPDWEGDLLVAQHGSWNRSVPSGYKVVRLVVDGNGVTGEEDLLSGFLQNGNAWARPVDVIFDTEGSAFISDDKGGNIFKVVPGN